MKDVAAKRKILLARIESSERAIQKAREYLGSDKHATWVGFRAVFSPKVRGGKELPPHKDWVRNVFLPYQEKVLARAEKLMQRLT